VKIPIYIEQKQHNVTASCHAALLRLREIAEKDDGNDQTRNKAVGEGEDGDKQGPLAKCRRLLWIDAICVNQDDDVLRHCV
jgi:hypothetical protein